MADRNTNYSELVESIPKASTPLNFCMAVLGSVPDYGLIRIQDICWYPDYIGLVYDWPVYYNHFEGVEAVPMASGLVDNTTNDDLHVQTEDMSTKLKKEKVRKNQQHHFNTHICL